MAKRTGITVSELVVVGVLIALVAVVIRPTLGGARGHAKQIVCLSNQRQIILGLIKYADEHDDYFPPATYWSESMGRWMTGMNARHTVTMTYDGQWIWLGRLFDVGIMEAEHPTQMYCPAQSSNADLSAYSYEIGWEGQYRDRYADYMLRDLERRWCSYMYRPFNKGPWSGAGYTWEYVEWVNNLQKGAVGTISLTADYFFAEAGGLPEQYGMGIDTWPHKGPYGANVGFSDGGVRWVATGKEVWETSQLVPVGDPSYSEFRDGFAVNFFRDADLGDFSYILENAGLFGWPDRPWP